MRQKIEYTVTDEKSRDNGKTFIITEMSAYAAEKWALKAFFAMANAGIEIPDDYQSLGMEGLVAMGLNALGHMRFEEAEPLLDEMMLCVRIMPDRNKPSVIRNLIEDDIEEIKTRLLLRKEVLQMHMGFSLAADPSTSGQAAQTAKA